MRTIAVLLVFFASFLLVLERGGSPHTPSQGKRDDDCGCDETSLEKASPYANRIDPAAYHATVEAVRQMPAEPKYGGRLPAGVNKTAISQYTWQSFGPMGTTASNDQNSNREFGRIRSMQWYYNTVQSAWELYLGASSGGLWFGQTALFLTIFQSLGDHLENPSVGAFAIDPTDPNSMIVGTGDWNRYFGDGVFTTPDRGVTWFSTYVYPYPNFVTRIRYLVGNSVVIMSTDKGVFRSSDGGHVWSHLTVEPADSNAPCFDLVNTNSATIYAALAGRGIYKSPNGGFNWTKISSGLPATSSTIAIDASKSNPEILYTSYADVDGNQGGIFKSTDSGGSWNPVPTPAPAYLISGQGGHVNTIRIHPTNPDIVYAAAVGMVKTTDGGSSWTALDRNARGHDDITTIDFSPSDPTKVYICSDGGIVLRDENTNTYDNHNYRFDPGAPLLIYEMDFAWSESNVMVAGLQDNGLIMTNDASTPQGWWFIVGGCDGANNISIDPTDANTFWYNQFCGPSNQPRFRTDTRGASYTVIDQGLPNAPYIPLRYNKGGPGYLWTLSGSTLYHSTDKGNSWQTSLAGMAKGSPDGLPGLPQITVNNYAPKYQKETYMVWPSSIQIADGTPGVMSLRTYGRFATFIVPDRWHYDWVYALAQGSLKKSTDRGLNWTDISGTNPWNGTKLPPDLVLYDVVASQQYSDAIYLGTNLGVFKTIDGGKTWSQFQNGLPIATVTKMDLVPGIVWDTLRIGTFGRGFWQRLIFDVDPKSLNQSPVNGATFTIQNKFDKVLAGGAVGGMHHSTDGGKSWQEAPTGVTRRLTTGGMFDDMTAVFAGDTGTAIRTTDGGATWNPIPPPTGANITGMTITAGGNAWMCADDGTLARSIDGGVDWIPQPGFGGVNLRAVQFFDDAVGMLLGRTTVGGSSDILYFTTNGGAAWNPSVLPTGGIMEAMSFTGDSDGFVVGGNGTIAQTTDAGGTWTLDTSGVTAHLRYCRFTGEFTGYACGDSGTLLKTEDGGRTWSDVSPGGSANLYALGMSPSRLIVGGDGGVSTSSLLHQNRITYSLGDRWNMVALPLSMEDTSIGALFPSHGSSAFQYTPGGAYAISPTMSPGAGYWLKFGGEQVMALTGVPAQIDTIPLSTGWNLIGTPTLTMEVGKLSGSPAGLVTSQFFGYNGSYFIASTLEPGKAYWVKANQPGSLVVGAGGSNAPRSMGKIRIEATSELPPPPPGGDAMAPDRLPREFSLDQNYPNPFNPSTTIAYTLPVDASVKLTIYDIAGRQVDRIVDGREPAGEKRVRWNASRVASGVYFCRVEAEALDHSRRFTAVRKMLLIR